MYTWIVFENGDEAVGGRPTYEAVCELLLELLLSNSEF